MAITIATTPDTVSFTGIPIVFEVTSDRDAADTSGSVTVANNGGFCQYTYTSHPFVADDIITGSGYAASGLNVRQTVTSDDGSNTFTTDLVWTSAYTGDSGTITRSNDNFQVRCDVTVGGSIIATFRKYANSGTYTFNVSKVLQDQMSANPIALTNVKPVNDTSSFKSYTVTFTEEFDDVDGLLQEGGDDTSGTLYATLGSPQYADTQSTAAYLTAYGGVKVPLTNATSDSLTAVTDGYAQASFIVDNSTYAMTLFRATITTDLGDANSSTETITGDYKKIVVPLTPTMWTYDSSNPVVLKLYGNYDASWRHLGSLTVNFKELPSHGKVLWWLNPLGGWDTYVFTGQTTAEQTTEKTVYEKSLGTSYTVGDRGRDVLDATTKERWVVSSLPIPDDTVDHVLEIFRSKDVRLLDGTTFLPVVVTSTTQSKRNSEGLTRITLEYELAYDIR